MDRPSAVDEPRSSVELNDATRRVAASSPPAWGPQEERKGLLKSGAGSDRALGPNLCGRSRPPGIVGSPHPETPSFNSDHPTITFFTPSHTTPTIQPHQPGADARQNSVHDETSVLDRGLDTVGGRCVHPPTSAGWLGAWPPESVQGT